MCAFKDSGLESFVAPPSLCKLWNAAFMGCRALKHVDLSSCTFRCGKKKDYLALGIFQNCGLESVVLPRTLRVVGERAFSNCTHLKHVSFGEDSMLEEIGYRAFFGCALESFTAPASLKKIGAVAFGANLTLRNFKLNDDIQDVDWLCFWATGIEELKLPQKIKKTPE